MLWLSRRLVFVDGSLQLATLRLEHALDIQEGFDLDIEVAIIDEQLGLKGLVHVFLIELLEQPHLFVCLGVVPRVANNILR